MPTLNLSDEVLDVGDEIIITATFTDLDDPANPSTIAWQIRDPAGTVETFDEDDSTSSDVGTWDLAYTITKDLPGTWYVRVAGTAGVIAAAEGPFVVRSSMFVTP